MIFTPEMIRFIEKHLPLTDSDFELAESVNKTFRTSFTYDQIRFMKRRHKLKRTHQGSRIPLYTERVNNKGFTIIKVSNEGKTNLQRWKKKHIWAWEQTYGEIPKGYKVIFLDGNRSNFELDNLALATDGEVLMLAKLGLRFKDNELAKTGLAIVRHSTAIHEKLKQELGNDGHDKYFKKIANERKKKKREEANERENKALA